MKQLVLVACALFPPATTTASDNAREALIVVVGAAGGDDYEGEFEGWAAEWTHLAERNAWDWKLIGAGGETSEPESSKTQLKEAITASSHVDRLWIVLLGHGTFSGKTAKFNLAGPDVSSKELASWLKTTKSQVVIVNCSSSSSRFLSDFAGRNRIVVTATRSSSEINYSRFGKYFSQCINSTTIDVDHDNEVSLLEAFLTASARTERFYLGEARLMTEHALLDDNGDRVGTSADFYQGIRPIKQGADGKQIDGAIAARIILRSAVDKAPFPRELEEQRQTLEQELDRVRKLKDSLPSDEYYSQLESIFLQLAALYDKAEEEPDLRL